MVQKTQPRPRGRPRAYDPDRALAQALEAFWLGGYSATSLDDLSAATGMNRPSLYAAFGDKQRLYLQLLERYTATSEQAIAGEFERDQPLATALTRFYKLALAMYLPEDGAPRGCFLIGTALTEAVNEPLVREHLIASLNGFGKAVEKRLRRAQAEGDLDPQADTAGLAAVAGAVLHSLAVRARAGDSRSALNALVKASVNLICGKRS
jgi:AcrR family transcriptional regulator